MLSIAWFSLAILLFQLTERAILLVVVLGAAPAIANGLIHGIDHTPLLLNRAGRVLGASGMDRYRFIVLPAALPGFAGGLKQGWAFARGRRSFASVRGTRGTRSRPPRPPIRRCSAPSCLTDDARRVPGPRPLGTVRTGTLGPASQWNRGAVRARNASSRRASA